jgi:hypothetical protein
MGGLLARNLQIDGRDLLGVGDGLLHADRELEGFSSCITLLLTAVSDEHIALRDSTPISVGIFRSR